MISGEKRDKFLAIIKTGNVKRNNYEDVVDDMIESGADKSVVEKMYNDNWNPNGKLNLNERMELIDFIQSQSEGYIKHGITR